MNIKECTDLIGRVYGQVVPGPGTGTAAGPETRLLGGDSQLDSIALVTLLVEVEQEINTALGVEILIADDRAMSQKRSPFRSINSLAEYVVMLVEEKRNAA